MALIKSTSHKTQFGLLDAAVLVLLVGAIASAAVFFTTDQRVEQTKAQRDSIQLKKILTTEPQLNTDVEKLFYCIGIEQRQDSTSTVKIRRQKTRKPFSLAYIKECRARTHPSIVPIILE